MGRAGRRHPTRINSKFISLCHFLPPFKFKAFTAALYCVPTLFRFFKNLSNPAQRAAQPADDTVYVCHDEAFLQPKA